MGKLRWLWQWGAEAAVGGTRLLTGAWPRAGLEQSLTLTGALAGVGARRSTDLSGQVHAISACLHCSLLNPVGMPLDVLFFRSSGTVSPIFS